jgi:hypothetical protein
VATAEGCKAAVLVSCGRAPEEGLWLQRRAPEEWLQLRKRVPKEGLWLRRA